MSGKPVSRKERERRDRQRTRAKLAARLVDDAPRAIVAPCPDGAHRWGPWGEWRPPLVVPALRVRWFHVERPCLRCSIDDSWWIEREPDVATLAERLRVEPVGTVAVPLAEYLTLAGITLPDPASALAAGELVRMEWRDRRLKEATQDR